MASPLRVRERERPGDAWAELRSADFCQLRERPGDAWAELRSAIFHQTEGASEGRRGLAGLYGGRTFSPPSELRFSGGLKTRPPSSRGIKGRLPG